MCFEKDHVEEGWISIILRMAIAMLFAVAASYKFIGGIGTTVQMFEGMFKATWLPMCLVTPYAYSIAYIEALIALWLLSGFKLRAGWICTSLVLISLAFGLTVAKQPSADLFTYLIIACAGIYVSRYDHCGLGKQKTN